LVPSAIRGRAIDKAVAFVTERLNGDDGLGAIFPAMANTVMMFDALGYERDHPDLVMVRKAIDKLLVVSREEAYCQPCVSPVWDTVLACHALLGDTAHAPALAQALDFLRRDQEDDGSWYGRWGMNYIYGTWSVLCALNAAGVSPQAPEVRRAVDWLIAAQNQDGGWGETGESYGLKD